MKRAGPLLSSLACFAAAVLAEPPAADSHSPGTPPATSAAPMERTELSLDQCLATALERNHRRPISRFALAIAESQHRQALAAYWPQVHAKAGYERLSDSLNFIFPGESLAVPAQSVTVPGGTMTVTIPANSFAPGFPPSAIQMPVSFPAQTYKTAAQIFAVPQQDVKVLDRDLVSGTAGFEWLLWDGGMRRGLREESNASLAMMRQEIRRTDLEIADSVTQLYWGAVLARRLHELGNDTLARLESTLRLTETMYKEGAGKVTRADYLDNSVMVETVRAMVADLEKNEQMSEAALANTMGLEWNASVRPAAAEIPFAPGAPHLAELVATAYRFNPDWNQLREAMRAARAGVAIARSGHYPKLGLTGELHAMWNGGYTAGISTPQNRDGWTAGVGLEIPIFDGFLTNGRVSEAMARQDQLRESQFLLREGIALKIKDLVLSLGAAAKAGQASQVAMTAARENRELNMRAYEDQLVDTEKVIRAQLTEALMTAQHQKARYDYAALLSRLSVEVGAGIGGAVAEVR